MRISHKLVAAVVSAVVLASSAYADDDDDGGKWHGHGHRGDHEYHEYKHGKEKHDKHHKKHHHDEVFISDPDRVVIREYIVGDYGSHCPPGLAKKHNGCMPPGHAKRHYVVGQAIPSYVTWQPVPEDLLVRLQPVPVGYQYVMVDRDVLLVSEASKKVIDAITLLSAVGK